MNFADNLERTLNHTRTGNGDITYKSTLDANLDLFYKAGGVRSNNYYGDLSVSTDDYRTLFTQAYLEDPDTALRNLLNIRDFRHDGKGERQLFRVLLDTLAQDDPEVAVKLIKSGIVAELGRWDDLVAVFGSIYNDTVKQAVVTAIQNELKTIDADHPSLLPKWLPTNTRNKTQYTIAKQLAKALGYSEFRQYRKAVVAARRQLNLIETNLTDHDYDAIEIDHVPSRAFKKYQTALFTHKEAAMHQYLDDITAGKKTAKVTGVTPNEIIKPYTDAIGQNCLGVVTHDESTPQQDAVIEAQWSAMKQANADVGNTLVIADVSGSMFGQPLSVSVGLAILFAQTMAGVFHNKFMTFSGKPKFVSLPDNASLKQTVTIAAEADWGFNTDINKAFAKILETAVTSKADQADLPERLVIISDMQFDQSQNDQVPFWDDDMGGVDTPNFDLWQQKFADVGYQLPTVVYWNVSSYANTPATVDSTGGVDLGVHSANPQRRDDG